MLTAPGGYPTKASWAPAGTGRELDGGEDAAAVVGQLAAAGAAAIKVSLNAEAGPTPGDGELAAICEAAHEAGLPVTVHAQGEGQVERALGAGVDELAHTPWTHRLSEDVIAMAARSDADRLDARHLVVRQGHAGDPHGARQPPAVPRRGRHRDLRDRPGQRRRPSGDPRARVLLLREAGLSEDRCWPR